MRVLFNTYPVAFDCPGGGEVQLLRCREALERRGVEVLLHDPWKPLPDGVDLVHYFSVQGGSMNFCAHVKRCGLPLVISPVLWIAPETAAAYPVSEIRDLLHLCDRALPNSRAEAARLAEFFGLPAGKFSVVYNGVDPVFGVPADPGIFRQWAGLAGPFVLNVANVEERKNQLRLARAARALGVDLAVLGNVRDGAYLEACRREGGSRFRHLGYVEHGGKLLRSAYAGCAVFALPSLLETPGLAALEAAAAGARVVATSEGSAREYFGEAVGYADPFDEAGLRPALAAQMARPRDSELSHHVLSAFTWDRAADQLVEAYGRVLGRGV